MKRKRTIIALVLIVNLLLFASLFSGCGEAKTYTVSFDLNGGTGSIEDQNVKEGEKAMEPAEEDKPMREGYDFAGWYTAAEGGEEYDFSNPVTEDLVLYARWDVKTYTVTFMVDDEEYDTQTVEYGTGATAPENPTKASTAQHHYQFNGWDKEFDNITGDLIVNALFIEVAREYNVTFMVDDQEYDTQTVEYGTGATAPENPTKASTAQYHYQFSGWDKDFDNVTGDLIVNALFTSTLREYTVTFMNDDEVVGTKTVYYGECVVEPSESQAPTRDGYRIEGWYTANTGGEKFNFDDPVTGEVRLYVQWVKVWTVTFELGNGEDNWTQIVDDGDLAQKPQDDPVRIGYIFYGWYTEAQGGQAFEFENTTITSDTPVYAQWLDGLPYDELRLPSSMPTFDDDEHNISGSKLENLIDGAHAGYRVIMKVHANTIYNNSYFMMTLSGTPSSYWGIDGGITLSYANAGWEVNFGGWDKEPVYFEFPRVIMQSNTDYYLAIQLTYLRDENDSRVLGGVKVDLWFSSSLDSLDLCKLIPKDGKQNIISKSACLEQGLNALHSDGIWALCFTAGAADYNFTVLGLDEGAEDPDGLAISELGIPTSAPAYSSESIHLTNNIVTLLDGAHAGYRVIFKIETGTITSNSNFMITLSGPQPTSVYGLRGGITISYRPSSWRINFNGWDKLPVFFSFPRETMVSNSTYYLGIRVEYLKDAEDQRILDGVKVELWFSSSLDMLDFCKLVPEGGAENIIPRDACLSAGTAALFSGGIWAHSFTAAAADYYFTVVGVDEGAEYPDGLAISELGIPSSAPEYDDDESVHLTNNIVTLVDGAHANYRVILKIDTGTITSNSSFLITVSGEKPTSVYGLKGGLTITYRPSKWYVNFDGWDKLPTYFTFPRETMESNSTYYLAIQVTYIPDESDSRILAGARVDLWFTSGDTWEELEQGKLSPIAGEVSTNVIPKEVCKQRGISGLKSMGMWASAATAFNADFTFTVVGIDNGTTALTGKIVQ